MTSTTVATYTYSGATVLTTGPTTSADPSWHVQTEESFDSHGWLTQRVVKPAADPRTWQTQRFAYDPNGLPR